MLSAMSLGDWFRRLFSPSTDDDSGAEAAPGSVVTGGVSGFAGLEDAEAAEEELEQFEPPHDPAP
jgi:hypothetical protein